jgi:two-component system NarL family response regulator
MSDFLEDFLGESEWSEAEIRLLVCDDHALFRRGLIATIEEQPDLEVLGEASTTDEAVELAEELAPDVILMDVRMPGGGGIEATRRISELVPGTRVLMLTVSDDPDDLLDAVKAGAAGYLLKEVTSTEVANAVRAVHAGSSPLSPALADKLMAEFMSLEQRADETPTPPKLAPRELEVLRLLAQGLTNRAIAEHLGISPNTVKNHVGNILEKLHLHSRTEAAMYAVRERLLDAP